MQAGVTGDTRGEQDFSVTCLLSLPVGFYAAFSNTCTPLCPFPDFTVHYEMKYRDGKDTAGGKG